MKSLEEKVQQKTSELEEAHDRYVYTCMNVTQSHDRCTCTYIGT